MFKFIKLELFYWRQMFQRGFPLRYFLNYIKNRYFGSFLLKNIKPWRSDRKDNFEIHVLSPKSGLWMLYWDLRSFLHFSGLSPAIFIHSDGSIDSATAKMFESKLSNITVVLKKDADRVIGERKDIPEKIKKYRMAKPFPIMELVDIFLLSKSEIVMLLDFDFLFYNKPDEIVDFVNGKSEHDALSTRFSKGSALNVKEEYLKKYNLISREADKLISGIIIYKKSKLPLEKFIEYFDNTLDPTNPFIEQAGWGSLISQSNFKWLDEIRYPIKGMPEEAVCKHFTTPRRFEMYAYGIDQIRKRIS